MRYSRAVSKLRQLAEECDQIVHLAAEDEDPFLVAMYAFGDVLEGSDPIEVVEVAGVIRLSPEEVTWGSSPRGTEWLADRLRLGKGNFTYYWRSYLDPVWNHYIRSPVRIWSRDGIDEHALAALAGRRFSELKRLTPDPVDERLQLRDDLDAALSHLRDVHGSYWDQEWRREHRGFGRYAENELWDAVEGYLSLLNASRPAPAADSDSAPVDGLSEARIPGRGSAAQAATGRSCPICAR